MITGDARQVADGVAGELGIDEVCAGGPPERQGPGGQCSPGPGSVGGPWWVTESTTPPPWPGLTSDVVAVPLAAGAGVTMPPAVGALLISGSAIVLALNSGLLRRIDLRPHSAAAHV